MYLNNETWYPWLPQIAKILASDECEQLGGSVLRVMSIILAQLMQRSPERTLLHLATPLLQPLLALTGSDRNRRGTMLHRQQPPRVALSSNNNVLLTRKKRKPRRVLPDTSTSSSEEEEEDCTQDTWGEG